MRRIPGVRRLVVAQALTVRMTKHSGSLRTTRPVLAGHVFVGRESGAVWLRTSENIVTVRIVAAPIVYLPFLAERGLLGEIVGAMQLRDVLGDSDTLGIRPRTFADAIACIYRTGTLC